MADKKATSKEVELRSEALQLTLRAAAIPSYGHTDMSTILADAECVYDFLTQIPERAND